MDFSVILGIKTFIINHYYLQCAIKTNYKNYQIMQVN